MKKDDRDWIIREMKEREKNIKNGQLITTFKQVQEIIRGLPKEGVTEKVYRGILRRIESKDFRAYFKREAKCPSLERSWKEKNESPNTTQNRTHFSPKAMDEGNAAKENEDILVRPTEFSFEQSSVGPKLIWGEYECLFYGAPEWFERDVLESIERTFTIRVSQALGLRFEPYSDREVLRDELDKAYQRKLNNLRTSKLNEILESIDWRINLEAKSYKANLHRFEYDIHLKDCVYDREKGIYIKRLNLFDCLCKDASPFHTFTIPYKEIITYIGHYEWILYKKEIEKRWVKGYTEVINLKELFSKLESEEIEIIVPKVYVNDYRIKDTVKVRITISEWSNRVSVRLLWPDTTTPPMTQPFITRLEKSKQSIQEKIKKLEHTPIVDCLKTAYIDMFSFKDDGSQNFQEKKRLLTDVNIDTSQEDWTYVDFDHWRFHTPLYSYEKESEISFKWLKAQVKLGKYNRILNFEDLNRFVINKNSWTVTTYLAISDTMSNPFNIRWGEMVKIDMYALDTTKCTYQWQVKKDQLEEAIFYIWAYFSSQRENKRERINKMLDYARMFGIIYYEKRLSLHHNYSFGYHGDDWVSHI